jgi:poly-gamma-glutamate capsule biosynthesis protein CapA/YwtB (metallophosphatase superfamily)
MKKPWRINLILLAALQFYACSRPSKVIMSFTGDIMMHIPVKACALAHNKMDHEGRESLNNRGFDFLFRRIKGSLRDSDIAVGNMEFPVSPPFVSKPKIFNCYPEVISAMARAGFTMLFIGNNHILDQGEKGVVHTMGFIRRNRLEYLGVSTDERTARAGIVKKINGIRIGFLGYAGYMNYPLPRNQRGYHVNWFYDRGKVISDIERMRSRCDYLVMVVHTGVEYESVPRPKDRSIIKEYIDHGVDLVIAHHPHLLQPAERFTTADGREGFAFYSLGNFISNQDSKAQFYVNGVGLTTRDSIIVRCILSRSDTSRRPRARFEVEPICTINEGSGSSRVIQTVSIRGEIDNLKKGNGQAEKIERVDINRRILNLYQKSRAIKDWILSGYRGREITFAE